MTQYVKKTLAKKRLSAEKAGAGRGEGGVDGDVGEAGKGASSSTKAVQPGSQSSKVRHSLVPGLSCAFYLLLESLVLSHMF